MKPLQIGRFVTFVSTNYHPILLKFFHALKLTQMKNDKFDNFATMCQNIRDNGLSHGGNLWIFQKS